MKLIKYRMLPVLLAGSFFFHPSAVAQPAWTIFNDTNSLLPQNTIRCIAVDAQNRKWIGTDWGLAVYNDTSWTVYDTSNSNITDNSIRSLAFDISGDTWIGTFTGGVVKYDGSTWTPYSTGNSGLPNNFVKAIAFDTAGTPWFGTAGGLAHFNGSAWQTWNMSNSPMLSVNIACLVIGSNNMKYFGTLNGGMVYFDGDTTWELYNHINGQLPDNTVLSIALDSNSTRWVAMPAQGLFAHPDVGPPGWWDVSSSLIPSNSIVHVMVDAAQKKYMGSQDEGFIIFDGTTFVNYKMNNSPMPDDYVLCTTKDHNGILWVGTYNGGLVRVDESLIISVNETEKETSSFNIYPNPARDELFVMGYKLSERTVIEVYDMLGQKIFPSLLAPLSFRRGDERGEVINISSLPAGIYFIKIYLPNQVLTKAFIKAD